ncbi:hypothetical protein KBZ08_14085 [Cyanobium sp. Candia 9D4]|uniref:hypothetical protein n=1 Tax=Cyanobium sp. Candia 9D4 TaxID=2823707 RepID=UPI0020CC5DF1|nr:hypothetical protein [Cyanobium sp. Candia 9D4]MCP9935039.1 hypothetical protein [Cyanobium sp. Candia 9D4]
MTSKDVAEYYKTQDYHLHDTTTVEQIVEAAVKMRAEEQSCPLNYCKGSFWRYDPDLGYYKRTCHSIIQLEISEILPRIYTESGAREPRRIRQKATSQKIKATISWLETRLGLQEMDANTAIAFKNGTLYFRNICWELGEHSPSNNLTYGIEADWVEDADCPPMFNEFVRTSYGLAWLNMLRGVFAYHADPRYGCSVITMIIGNSGTGKGVTERLLEKMYSKESIGVITSGFRDLNSPEKVSQLVVGKRLIALPDLQGHQDGLGAILSLTDGGILTARALYSNITRQFVFDGRVVACSTQAPAMDNAGVGMTRRLLTLKTLDRRLESGLLPSDGVALEMMLHNEIGALLSWSLQMPEQEVKDILKLKDPAGLLQEVSLGYESQMDSVRIFIDCSLVPSESTCVPDTDYLYKAYKLLCMHLGDKACHRDNFVKRMR